MSKFFEALEQAERDRALRRETAPAREPAPPPTPAPPAAVESAPVPEARVREASERLEDHLVSLLDPSSLEAEQYRTLGHLLEQAHKTAGLSVIGVSSPTVGDGKTVTAINVAASLAQAARARVLLVDADLRRPSVARYLGLGEVGSGLVRTILHAGATLADAAVPYPPFHLRVVPAGRHANVTSEVLKSPRVGELLGQARSEFDYVVLDLPPLIPIPDCRIVERWIDGFLVVVAADRTPRRLVEEALAVLEPAKVLGLVFNADDGPRSSYGYEYVAAGKPERRRSLLGGLRRRGR
jgi:capsular exopolysaccharide synthesis family protein